MAQIKFDKRRKLKALLAIQSNEATLLKALKPWHFRDLKKLKLPVM